MKLKKIASLMLAGVMAVSMLAGCSGKGNGGDNNNGGNTVVEPSTSSIVKAFNDGQDEDNEVKVTFSSDASLDTALKKAIENAGEDAFSGNVYGSPLDAVKDYVERLMGKAYDSVLLDNTAANKDGQSATVFKMYYTSSTVYWTEEDAVNAAARAMNEYIKTLKATTKVDGMKVGAKYYDFSYTGTVSMVSAKQEGGSTVYYVAYTITQTAAEQTVKAE